MRILLISNLYPSEKDKYYGIFVQNSVKGLEKEGISFSRLIVIKGRSKTIPVKFLKYIKFYFEILFYGLLSKYDCIYVHYINYSALPLLVVRFFREFKLVINFHGGEVFTISRTAFFLQKLSIPLIRNAGELISPSFFLKGSLSSLFKISEEKIFVSASGGLDEETFRPLISPRSENIFTVGYVSRIDKGKGWNVFVEVIYNLVKIEKRKSFNALVVGDGEEVTMMQNMINNLDLNGSIKYIGGIEQAKIPKYMAQMDVFVFPTMLNESLGLVALEAMACGLPVIASKVAAIPEYVEDGYNGFLCKPGDIVGFSGNIIKVHNLFLEKEPYFKMRENAMQTAKKYISHSINYLLSQELKRIIGNDK